VKDLGARSKISFLLLALTTLLGCTALDAKSAAPGPGSKLVASDQNLNFGTIVVGGSKALTNTVVNRSWSKVTIMQAAVDRSEFSIQGQSLPVTLAPGQSTSLNLTYTPRSHGRSSGTVSLASNRGTVGSFTLSGSAVSPNLTVTPASINFGNVTMGSTQSQSAILSNAGSATLTVNSAKVTGAGFNITGLNLPLSLAPGQSATAKVSFSPPATGTDTGNISLGASVAIQSPHRGHHHSSWFASSNTNFVVNVAVAGAGIGVGQLTAAPASVNLGNVQVGATQTQPASLINAGGTDVTVNQATITGTGFSMSGLLLPLKLAAGQSKSFNVGFKAQVAGTAHGSIAISSDAANAALNMTLSATGIMPGALVSNPSSLGFGAVSIGTTQTLAATVTNSGGSGISVTQASASGTGFKITGPSLPISLAVGQSATFTVSFNPQLSGPASGNLSIVSTASDPSLTIPLSGSGISAGSLSANPSSLSFGNVQLGNTQNLQATLTNSGGSAVSITQASTSGAGFSVTGPSLPMSLAGGQSAIFSVAFNPQSGNAVTGNLSIVGNGAAMNIPLSGKGATPGLLSASSQTINFGNVQVNSSNTNSETLTNTGGSNVNVSQANASGTGFSVSGLNLPLTLTPGQSFTFGAVFAPTSAGNDSGTITVTSDASNSTLTIALSGSGASPGQLTVSPATLSFGNVIVGQKKSMTATLGATGSSVSVSAASAGSSEFSISGVSLPMTVAAGQSVPITITFTPQSSGTATATASFASNATNSPATQGLTGSGTAAPQHSVDLSWSASSSSDVTGYNVYRGTTTGGPYTKINSALSTSYTDASVQAGQTYYYVTTAVDTTGKESGFSNQVKAAIPTP
jgi:Abnormal spindle-like microcephaly-assoc'd, ASPM-SPD-2-Hydin